jgi:hypothetical protein
MLDMVQSEGADSTEDAVLQVETDLLQMEGDESTSGLW